MHGLVKYLVSIVSNFRKFESILNGIEVFNNISNFQNGYFFQRNSLISNYSK